MLLDRGESVPAEQRMEAARQIKEQHSYLCQDVAKEYKKYDQDPRKFKTLSGVVPKTKEAWSIQVGYERFLAPEVLFNPGKMLSNSGIVDTTALPLTEVVDSCIVQC